MELEYIAKVEYKKGVSAKTNKPYDFFVINLVVGNYNVPVVLKENGISKQVLLDDYTKSLPIEE